jgi:hypothetical protein
MRSRASFETAIQEFDERKLIAANCWGGRKVCEAGIRDEFEHNFMKFCMQLKLNFESLSLKHELIKNFVQFSSVLC